MLLLQSPSGALSKVKDKANMKSNPSNLDSQSSGLSGEVSVAGN